MCVLEASRNSTLWMEPAEDFLEARLAEYIDCLNFQQQAPPLSVSQASSYLAGSGIHKEERHIWLVTSGFDILCPDGRCCPLLSVRVDHTLWKLVAWRTGNPSSLCLSIRNELRPEGKGGACIILCQSCVVACSSSELEALPQC